MGCVSAGLWAWPSVARPAVAAIKQASPATKIYLDEVGICLTCGGPGNAMTYESMRGNLPNASWWNVQAVTWVYYCKPQDYR